MYICIYIDQYLNIYIFICLYICIFLIAYSPFEPRCASPQELPESLRHPRLNQRLGLASARASQLPACQDAPGIGE